MYCEFCEGSGQKVSYYNNEKIYQPCPHCDGTGHEPNNHWGSLDKEYIEVKEKEYEDYYGKYH